MTKSRIVVHAAWATWQRERTIDESVAAVVRDAVATKCAQLDCGVIAIGFADDHVHVLAELNPTISTAKLIGEAKGVSSFLVSKRLKRAFRWQDGYWAASVSVEVVPSLTAYVQNQRQHHSVGHLLDDYEP